MRTLILRLGIILCCAGLFYPRTLQADELHSLDEVLGALPAGVDVVVDSEPNAAGIVTANAWLMSHYKGRKIALKMKLESTVATTAGGYAYEAIGGPRTILCDHDAISSRAVAMFRVVAAPPLGRVPRNTDFNVRGSVLGAAFSVKDHLLTFTLAIGDSQVDNTPAAVASTPAAAPGDPASEAEAGAIQSLTTHDWVLEAPLIHLSTASRFAKGGAWTFPALKTSGTWKIQNNELLLTAPEMTVSPAVFKLPLELDNWEGVGADGSTVFLSTGASSAAQKAPPIGQPGPEGTPAVSPTPDSTSYFGERKPHT